MKALIQRVSRAGVSVDGRHVSAIGPGLCVLLGVSRRDDDKHIQYLAKKVLNLRVFEDDNGKKWDKSVMDRGLEILCVSQFTLYSVLKGNKPDFHSAMMADDADSMYQRFLAELRRLYRSDAVKEGEFGAFMQVEIVNDGPVTIAIETPGDISEKQLNKQVISGPSDVTKGRGDVTKGGDDLANQLQQTDLSGSTSDVTNKVEDGVTD